MTREPTPSLPSGNVEYLDDIKKSLIIEVDVTHNKQYIGQLKDGSLFLLNDVEIT